MANLSNINGKFVVEQTTGYVGVGTTDPEYLLHINSSDIPNGTRLTIENTNGSGKKYGLISDNTGVFTVRDLTASSDRFAISNLGNATFTGDVGIGITATKALQVSGEALFGNGTNGLLLTYSNGNSSGIIDTGFNSTALEFRTGGSERLTINSSTATFVGNVFARRGSFGTASNFNFDLYCNGNAYINDELTVDDNATFAGSVTSNFQATTSSGSININSSDPTIRFNRVGGTTDKSIYELRAIAVGGTNDYFQLRKWNDAQTVASELMKIDNSGNTTFTGNVGIGGSPTTNYPLTLRSKSADYTKILDWGTDVGGSWGTMQIAQSAPYATELRSGAWNFAQGNVGIGTNSPGGLLTIKGTGDAIRVESTNTGAGGAQIDLLHFTTSPADNDTFALINMGGYYTGTTSVYGTSIKSIWTDVSARDAALTFSTNNGGTLAERMRITSAGGISFGSTGTAYGTSGQVLTSNGNAAPTWQAAGGGTVTWPNVGAGIRTDYILGFKPPGSGYAGFYFQTAAGGHAGYLLIRGTSNAGQIYKAEGITLVSDSSWVTIASRTTTNAGVRLMSGATSAERLVIQDNGHSYFQGNLGIGTSSTSFSSDYDNLIVGSGSGNNGIGIYSSSTGNSTLAFLPTTGSQSDFEIRVEHDYPFGNMEVYFQHGSDYYLRMFERNNGQDPIIKVGHNNIPVGINSGDDATMQFRPDSNNWYPAIAINAEDSQGNSRGFIEMKSNRSNTFQADYFLKFFNYNGNEIGSIRVNNNNNNVAYNTSSDYRLKEDLKEFKALDTISKIKVYNYKWKNDSSGFRDQGILAHELDELIPQAVSGEKDATDEDNNILPQSVDYSKIVPHLVQSIQELKAEIEILKNK